MATHQAPEPAGAPLDRDPSGALLDQTKALLADLVAFPTVSARSNLALIDYTQALLSDVDIPSTVIYDEGRQKANLFATLGPDAPGGIVLSGHTDVVPTAGQDWTSDPFTLREHKGRLYGRGTSDMKGFIAACLAYAPILKEAAHTTPIHFAFSYDEEIGCLGVRSMIEHIAQHIPRPKAVIVGEPTSMGVVNAHKGSRRFRTRVTGLEAHSSQTHLGVNAIAAAAKLINQLDVLQAELRERGDPTGRFEPPFTTIEVGTIQGGTAPNIIPRQCDFVWEYRMLPDQSPDEIRDRFAAFAEDEVLSQMQMTSADCKIETEELAFAPPLRAEPGSPAETLVFALAERNEASAVAFATEAGLFQGADIPAVVCGPGDIAQAHKPDEFIAVSELEACGRFLLKLADWLGSSARET